VLFSVDNYKDSDDDDEGGDVNDDNEDDVGVDFCNHVDKLQRDVVGDDSNYDDVGDDVGDEDLYHAITLNK
jgi:hypothetical protein